MCYDRGVWFYVELAESDLDWYDGVLVVDYFFHKLSRGQDKTYKVALEIQAACTPLFSVLAVNNISGTN